MTKTPDNKALKANVTVYEGARRFKPGSLESTLPERFKDKDHDKLREKILQKAPSSHTPAEPGTTETTSSQPTGSKAGSNVSADKGSG